MIAINTLLINYLYLYGVIVQIPMNNVHVMHPPFLSLTGCNPVSYPTNAIKGCAVSNVLSVLFRM
jgi:hypothetical protein